MSDTFPPAYDPRWAEETGKLAYDEAIGAQAVIAEWADAIDRKIVTVFGVSALLISVAPALKHAPSGTMAWWSFASALVLWAAAGFCCVMAYQARALQMLDPSQLVDPEWLSLSGAEYRFHRLRFIGDGYAENAVVIGTKVRWFKRAVRFTALEVAAIGLALLIAP